MSSPSSTQILRSRGLKLIALLALSLSLSACDYVASFTKPKQTPEEAKAEGIALGAACRQVGQSLEDCFQRNPNSLKAGIFAGWKDMNEYMAAKNIQTVAPPPPAVDPAAAKDKEVKEEAPKDERTLRRERRERERMDREKDAKSKDSDSPDKSAERSSDKSADRSSRKNRDDSAGKS